MFLERSIYCLKLNSLLNNIGKIQYYLKLKYNFNSLKDLNKLL